MIIIINIILTYIYINEITWVAIWVYTQQITHIWMIIMKQNNIIILYKKIILRRMYEIYIGISLTVYSYIIKNATRQYYQ